MTTAGTITAGTAGPSPATTTAGGGATEAGDDHGNHVEPGDDHGNHTTPAPTTPTTPATGTPTTGTTTPAATCALTTGRKVREAELRTRNGEAVWKKVKL